MTSFTHCLRSAAAFLPLQGKGGNGGYALFSSLYSHLSSLLAGLFWLEDSVLWSPSTTVTACFLLTNGLAMGNARLVLEALRTESLVRRAASISFEKDENVRFLRNTMYSSFMLCKHTLTSTSSSTGSTQSSVLSWNILTYRSRSPFAYCRAWPSLARVYFTYANKNLVLKAATICSQSWISPSLRLK